MNNNTFLEPTNPPPTSLPDLGVDPKEFDIVVRNAGFTTLGASKILAMAQVGEIAKRLGVVKIGRAKLLIADEQADGFIAKLDEIISGEDTNPKMKVWAIKAANELIGNRIRLARQLIASASIDQTDGAKVASPIPSFLPRVQIVPAGHGGPILDVAPIDEHEPQ